jgi:hypothetical protein
MSALVPRRTRLVPPRKASLTNQKEGLAGRRFRVRVLEVDFDLLERASVQLAR